MVLAWIDIAEKGKYVGFMAPWLRDGIPDLRLTGIATQADCS